MATSVRALVLAAVLPWVSCVRPPSFECSSASAPGACGPGGLCEATGFCSVADPACTSGRRYDPSAGMGLGGMCVELHGDGARREAGPIPEVRLVDAPALSPESTTATPTILASGQNHPLKVAIDGANLYWTDYGTCGGGDGTVMQTPLGGGALTTIASGRSNPEGIAIDSTTVYWTDIGGGTIDKVAKGGGGVGTLASGQTGPKGIAVDATHVYWSNYGSGAVMGLPLGGGSPTPISLSGTHPVYMALSPDDVLFWAEAPAGPGHCDTPFDGGVLVDNPPGSAASVFVSGRCDPWAVAADASSVYWVDQGDGEVLQSPRPGGGAVTVLATGQCAPIGIAIDATAVYWTTCGGGTVMKLPFGTSTPATLASGLSCPHGIAVDGSRVYWANYEGGTVMSTPK